MGGAALGRFDADARQPPVEPAGQPPVGAAEQMHEGGDQEGAQDEGVESNGGGEGHAEHRDDAVAAEHEGEEDRDHDDGGGVDHPAGLGEPDPDGTPVVSGFEAILRTSG